MRVRVQSPTSPSSKHFSKFSHLESERPAFDLMASRRHWECPPTRDETRTAAQAQAKRLRIEAKNAAEAKKEEAYEKKRKAGQEANEEVHPSKKLRRSSRTGHGTLAVAQQSRVVQPLPDGNAPTLNLDSDDDDDGVQVGPRWSPTLFHYPCAKSLVTSAQFEPLSVC